jgi:hypothetical protein
MQSLWIVIIVLSHPAFGEAVQILISSKFDLFTSCAGGIIELVMLAMSVAVALFCSSCASASSNGDSC